MQLIQNKWFVPLLAMVLVLIISTARVYLYVDGVLKAYTNSFRIDNSDHFVYWTFHTRELQQMIAGLTAKKVELDKQEETLRTWEARLQNEKKELAELKAQLETMRTGLGTLIVSSKADEMKNLKGLATTYAAMSPEAAVGVLNEMDEVSVVKILALMKSDTVGPIFEAMAKVPNQETQMRARIARLSEKLRLYKQSP